MKLTNSLIYLNFICLIHTSVVQKSENNSNTNNSNNNNSNDSNSKDNKDSKDSSGNVNSINGMDKLSLAQANVPSIWLYSDANYKGERKWIPLFDECSNVLYFNDIASSAHWVLENSEDKCVCFYYDKNCKGERLCWDGEVEYKHQPSDFQIDGINDEITSILVHKKGSKGCRS